MDNNNIMTIHGVDCYEENGTVYLSLEAVARGLGFAQTQKKNGVEYQSVRWVRIAEYLEEFGFPHKWGKGSYIPENIFYRLAMKAKNDVAEKFQSIVADEIIPSIRKHGMYLTGEAVERMLKDPDATLKLLEAYRDERNARIAAETTLEANKPKMLLANAIVDGDGCISVGELAKILKQNGVNTGQNRLFAQLRADGYLMSERRNDCNLPTQYSMDNGWMRIKKSVYYQNGQEYVAPVIRITGKGQLYFVNKYAKKAG